ncbi:unnamed protein product [Orchesella dallaii]|uniref:Uncharacterized protein n=1 Tax=Orchesella dallaii TaxID=48710 RepID=A0ABP1R6S9_9HEXA
MKSSTSEIKINFYSASDLQSIPEKTIYVLKDYDFEKQKHHSKDKGLTESEIVELGTKVANKQMKVAIYNKGHPRYHITVWIGDIVVEGNDFISGNEFLKDHPVTGRKCKSLYKVEGGKISGLNIYDNGEAVSFEAILKKEELLISVTSKSGCSELKLVRQE